MLIAGCSTVSNEGQGSSGGSGTPPEGDQSAASADVVNPSSFDLSPRNGRPVFLGVANRLMDREEEEAAAIRHIADQASRYEQIAASYQYVGQAGSSSVGYVEDIDVSWNEQRAEALVESVEVLRTVQHSEGTFVLGTVDGVPQAPPIQVSPNRGNDEPRWVNSPPQAEGYIVSVGVSQRSRRLKQSLDYADEQALAALLLQSNTTLRMIEDRRTVEERGTQDQLTVAQEASAQLAQFYIAARHISEDGDYYYSLAVARER